MCVCECVSCVYVRCKVNYSGKWIQHSLHVTRRQSTNFYRHRPAIWRPSTTVCLLRLSRCVCVRASMRVYGWCVCVWQSVCINFITTTQHSTVPHSRAERSSFPAGPFPNIKYYARRGFVCFLARKICTSYALSFYEHYANSDGALPTLF